MSTNIELPLWVLLVLMGGFIHAAIFGWFIPSLRWYVRSGSIRKADKKNSELQIQIRPFSRTPRRILVDRLKNDTEVLAEVDKLVQENKTDRKTLEENVHTYAREIVPYFNAQMYFSVGFRLAKFVLRFLYRIKISAKDTKLLDEVDPNATVVFVMNHRSNIDYLLVSYLVADKVALSYAVGEWARIFPLEQVVKSLGAFFVRRKSNNTLYRKVLERYVHMATQEGVCQAVYLEGGLSRDGGFQGIKLGYLDYILRGFDERAPRDVVFIPVAINYDRVLEDSNMLKWDQPQRQSSSTKQIWRVINFIRENAYIGARLRYRKFGYASVNFGAPVSCKDYQKKNGIRFSELKEEKRFKQVEALGQQLMGDIKHVMPVLPIPLLCCVFLNAKDNSLRSFELNTLVQSLIRTMIENGAAMKKREQPRLKTLHEALKLMVDRGMVLEEDDQYSINPGNLDLVQYYANSIQHWLR